MAEFNTAIETLDKTLVYGFYNTGRPKNYFVLFLNRTYQPTGFSMGHITILYGVDISATLIAESGSTYTFSGLSGTNKISFIGRVVEGQIAPFTEDFLLKYSINSSVSFFYNIVAFYVFEVDSTLYISIPPRWGNAVNFRVVITDSRLVNTYSYYKSINNTLNSYVWPYLFPGDGLGEGAVCIQTQRSNPLNVASGKYSIALGDDTRASQDHAIAIGYKAVASGYRSVAITTSEYIYNYQTQSYETIYQYGEASGNESLSIGGKASNYRSCAILEGEAQGVASLAMCKGIAKAAGSIAVGPESICTEEALNSCAIGPKAVVSGKNSICVGPGYVDTDNTIFVNDFFFVNNFYPQTYNIGFVNVIKSIPIELGTPPLFTPQEYNYFDIVRDQDDNYFYCKTGHELEPPYYKRRSVFIDQAPIPGTTTAYWAPYVSNMRSVFYRNYNSSFINGQTPPLHFIISEMFFVVKHKYGTPTSVSFTLYLGNLDSDYREYTIDATNLTSGDIIRLDSFSNDIKYIWYQDGEGVSLSWIVTNRYSGGSFVGYLVLVGINRAKMAPTG